MARDEPMAGARVGMSSYEVIEAVAFVRRTTMQGVLRPVLEAFAAQNRKDPAVRAALRARSQADAVR